jgi:AcrR family transcriptional regulator
VLFKSNVRLKKSGRPMPKSKSLEKSKEINRVIARLFAFKGYHSTSMREIAAELGMNQSSLYHYFKSKEDILFKLMNDAIDDVLAILKEICAADLPAEEKLKKVLGFYTSYYAGDQERLILLVNEMNSLDKRHRLILVDKQRQYVHLIKSILKELTGQHKLKKIHPSVAVFAFFGMVHYTIKWYHKNGSVSLDDLADEFVQIFTKGILNEGVQQPAKLEKDKKSSIRKHEACC